MTKFCKDCRHFIPPAFLERLFDGDGHCMAFRNLITGSPKPVGAARYNQCGGEAFVHKDTIPANTTDGIIDDVFPVMSRRHDDPPVR